MCGHGSLGRNQEVLYEVGKEQVTVDAQRIVHECLDGVWIEAVILDDQRKIQVQELADILAKSFSMYQKNKKIQGTIKNVSRTICGYW